MEQHAAPPVGLQHLPFSVMTVILEQVGGGGSGGGGAPAGTSDLVRLAFTCHPLLEAVATAEMLWQQQCRRLGWRCAGRRWQTPCTLAPAPAPAPAPSRRAHGHALSPPPCHRSLD